MVNLIPFAEQKPIDPVSRSITQIMSNKKKNGSRYRKNKVCIQATGDKILPMVYKIRVQFWRLQKLRHPREEHWRILRNRNYLRTHQQLNEVITKLSVDVPLSRIRRIRLRLDRFIGFSPFSECEFVGLCCTVDSQMWC